MNNDRITRWSPFLYRTKSLDGKKMETYTFTCPHCGGHNCEKIDDIDVYNFWSGHYRCTGCGATKDKKGDALNYYSDAFIRTPAKPQPQQLTLF